MMMSERSTSGEGINQKVEEGIKSFEVFQKKLKSIVHALNEQHSSMIELNNNRMKVRLDHLLVFLMPAPPYQPHQNSTSFVRIIFHADGKALGRIIHGK